MKAIFTQYHGASNTKPARVSATDNDGNKIVISRWSISDEKDIFREAALALCRKMNWTGKLAGGAFKNGYVYVFVKDTFDVKGA